MIGRMPRWPRPQSTGFWLLFVVAIAQTAESAPLSTSAAPQLCISAAQRAADRSGVPFAVLYAISQTETARGGDQLPWPWALNIGGEGFWFNNRTDALAKARESISRGIRNFDVGCFQLNYRWHGDQFASLSDMIDPDAGALYAAQFLTALHAETGDWSKAAGAYHSRTPAYAARYRRRFDAFHAAVAGTMQDRPGIFQEARENRFPLLRSGENDSRLGSLVPLAGGG